MKKTTLVIMAAGMGSRYGGIKQLEAVGPSGEIIMDYSVHDAIEAGFNRVVIIIRKDIAKDFYEVIGNRIEQLVEVEYVFQDLENLPSWFEKPEERTKPWGTGHAILSCKDVVNEPFVVINADDYYGKEGFKKIHEFLTREDNDNDLYQFCMAGFVLGNTLSDNGTVTRGICEVNTENLLVDIVETSGIQALNGEGVALNGEGETIKVNLQGPVSMNMWGFTPELFPVLEKQFSEFLEGLDGKELKAEFLLPEVVDGLIKTNKAEVRVLNTDDRWFGVTYKEDKQMVVDSFQELVKKGVYPTRLYK